MVIARGLIKARQATRAPDPDDGRLLARPAPAAAGLVPAAAGAAAGVGRVAAAAGDAALAWRAAAGAALRVAARVARRALLPVVLRLLHVLDPGVHHAAVVAAGGDLQGAGEQRAGCDGGTDGSGGWQLVGAGRVPAVVVVTVAPVAEQDVAALPDGEHVHLV